MPDWKHLSILILFFNIALAFFKNIFCAWKYTNLCELKYRAFGIIWSDEDDNIQLILSTVWKCRDIWHKFVEENELVS